MEHVKLKYHGVACWQILYKDIQLLIDPGHHYYDGLKSKSAENLTDINIICLTHTDFDHCNVLKFIPYYNEQIIIGLPEFREKISKNIIATNVKKENFPPFSKGGLGGFNFRKIEHSQTIEIKDIKIKALKIFHALRKWVSHTGYLITFGDFSIAHLGDGIKLDENIITDCLLINIGGIESNINNAAKITERISPSFVLPMHWKTCPFFYKRPEQFKKLIEKKLNNVKVIIPDKERMYNL